MKKTVYKVDQTIANVTYYTTICEGRRELNKWLKENENDWLNAGGQLTIKTIIR